MDISLYIIPSVLPIIIQMSMEFSNFTKFLIKSEYIEDDDLNRINSYSFVTLIAGSILIIGLQNIVLKYESGSFLIIFSVLLFINSFHIATIEKLHSKSIRICVCFLMILIISSDFIFSNLIKIFN